MSFVRLFTTITVLVSSLSMPLMAAELNIYSARKEALIKPLLNEFSQETGIKVNLITGKADGLITRMRSEKMLSPADLLLTTDVGRLVRAKSFGLTQPIELSNLSNLYIHDPNGHWVALTKRTRPIIVNPEKVAADAILTYEDLTKAEYKGRICVRSSNNVYNQSLVAAMLMQQGEEKTLEWAKGLVANFARTPKGGDRDQIQAVAAGICDIAIINTYYLAAMLNSEGDSAKAAQKVQVVWPNQDDRGTHINISGVAIAKYAKNITEAQRLIAFMLRPSSQKWYSEVNQEYPVVPGIEWSKTLKEMGEFKAESVDLEQVGHLNPKALKIMDKAGWL
jgi:iron(III) transport system substrate-binding protein